ncbi:MAG: P22 phage major capsid protein family protein [Candidatus Acidiferrum sp.]
MANQFLNVQWISDTVLELLLNELTVCEYFDHSFKKDFEKEFAVGSTIQVKFPQYFLVSDGPGYQPQGIDRISTTVSLDQWIQIAWEWDDYEAAVKAERSEKEIREQYLEPAASQIAQEWDSRAALWAKNNTNNVKGILGTDATSIGTYFGADQRLWELACPDKKRCMLVSSSMMTSIGENITTLFNPPDEISKVFKNRALGRMAGFDWFQSQSLWSQTAGTIASTLTVVGSGQSGTSLVVTGTSGDTLNQGDKITLGAVYQVNPRTRRYPGPKTLKNFVVTQSITLTGGNDTISILPAIYGPGSQYQNVDALPLNAAAVTLWPGTTNPNGLSGTVGLAITRSAFAMVAGKLYLPSAVEARSAAQDADTGMAIRWVKFWDPVRSLKGDRYDSIGGFGNLYQDNGAVAVVGA